MTQFASTLVWNAVLPALGLALILGAALLPAVAIAGAVTLALYAFSSGERRDVAPRRVLRGH